MHRLILMRHAVAEPRASSGSDRDRVLSAAGKADAAAMGRLLAARGIRPDLALVSAAGRTRGTWELAHEAFGDVEVRLLDSLYDAPATAIRRLIEAEEDNVGCLMVVAHNPGVHVLAVEYLTESAASPALLERMSGGFPPGSAAVFQVDAAGRPTYDGFFTPQTAGA